MELLPKGGGTGGGGGGTAGGTCPPKFPTPQKFPFFYISEKFLFSIT